MTLEEKNFFEITHGVIRIADPIFKNSRVTFDAINGKWAVSINREKVKCAMDYVADRIRSVTVCHESYLTYKDLWPQKYKLFIDSSIFSVFDSPLFSVSKDSYDAAQYKCKTYYQSELSGWNAFCVDSTSSSKEHNILDCGLLCKSGLNGGGVYPITAYMDMGNICYKINIDFKNKLS